MKKILFVLLFPCITSLLAQKNNAVLPENSTPVVLNGIYEYTHPHNSKHLIENHYIAFKKSADKIEGWYYGTSDEFDEAREGYLPGFFVAKMSAIKIKNNHLFFKIKTGYNKSFKHPVAVGLVDPLEILKTNEIWNVSEDNYVLEYSGEVSGQTLEMTLNGYTKKYKKITNSFQTGIDNLSKVQGAK